MSAFPPPDPLPRAPVLSYLTQAHSATRVRVVASYALLVMALLEVVSCLLVIMFLAMRYHRGWWFSFDEFLEEHILVWPLLILLALHFVPLFIVFRPVYSGSRAASRLAAACVVVVLVPLVCMTALCGALAVFGLGFFDRKPESHPEILAVGPVVPIGILLILLLKDLFAFLTWIARNPQKEKPPVAFISGRSIGPAE